MRYVTNEQRRRRTLFKPTLWAVADWLIFFPAFARLTPYVPHQFRARVMDADEEECKTGAGCSSLPPVRLVRALKISRLTRRLPGGMPPTYDSMQYVHRR
jgi:hypothetical protein